MREGASGAQADDVADLAAALKCGHATVGERARRADLALPLFAEEGNRLRPAALNPVATVDQLFCDRTCKEAQS